MSKDLEPLGVYRFRILWLKKNIYVNRKCNRYVGGVSDLLNSGLRVRSVALTDIETEFLSVHQTINAIIHVLAPILLFPVRLASCVSCRACLSLIPFGFMIDWRVICADLSRDRVIDQGQRRTGTETSRFRETARHVGRRSERGRRVCGQVFAGRAPGRGPQTK